MWEEEIEMFCFSLSNLDSNFLPWFNFLLQYNVYHLNKTFMTQKPQQQQKMLQTEKQFIKKDSQKVHCNRL